MRLVSFADAIRAERAGVWINDDAEIVPLDSLPCGAATLLDLIEAGPEGLAMVRDAIAHGDGAPIPTASVRLLAPIPTPPQMRDAMCFEAHLRQCNDQVARLAALRSGQAYDEVRAEARFAIPPVWFQQPLYYKANRFAVAGTGTEVHWPAYSQLMDYELELALVIGPGGKDIAEADAGAHIFGYTVFNDFSARDAQGLEMEGRLGPAKGKDFDGSNILGPCIVTADAIGDPYDLAMRAYVNDELWSQGHTGSIGHRLEALVAHASAGETLHPGEVIGVGTVGGGCGLELGRFLQPGDVVRLEIDGIGAIESRVVRESV